MPPEALHSARTIPRIRAVVALAAERCAADWMAWLKTPAAPGGRAFPSSVTSRFVTLVLMCSRLARPSNAMMAGNSARNQW